MKKIVLLTLLSAFGLLAMWGVNSCSKFDNNALNTSVNSNIYLAPVLIKFRNANTSSPIQFLGDSLNNYSFNCTITGPGAQYVVASDGSSLTAEYGENSFRTSNGVLALALVPNSIPSKSNPITFSINASFREKLYMSGKFAPISTSITITDTVVTVINVDVLELDRLVDGVAVTPNVNATLSAGTTTSDIIIPTTTNATMTEKATISIPTGTELKNAAGAVINASLATTNIVQYGAGSTTAAGVFPGSLEPKNVIGPDNKPIAGGVNFVSAGLLSINMVANDQLVKSFSKPLDVKMEIKSALNNFETDQPVKAGDSIPVWSLDETTGQWKYESKAAVTMNLSSNKLEANFKATHLSAWNLDWGWSMFGGYNTNNKPLKVNVSITDKTWVGYPYEVVLTDQYGNYLAANHGVELRDGYTCTFASTPKIKNAKIRIIKDWWSYGPVVAETALFDPETKGSVTVNFTPPIPPETVNLKMNVSGICSNKNTKISVGTWMYIYTPNFSDFNQCYVSTNGRYSTNNPVKLKTNVKYIIGTYYGGKYNYNYIELKSKSYYQANPYDKLPNLIGAGYTLSGSTNYTPLNNTLTLTFSFAVPCK